MGVVAGDAVGRARGRLVDAQIVAKDSSIRRGRSPGCVLDLAEQALLGGQQ